MASPAKTHLPLALFLVVLLFSSLHVHGRESKFFSKVTHVTEAAASPAPAPTEPEADSQAGYGLFGRGETDTKGENETPSEGLTGEGFQANTNTERQGMSDTRFVENGKYYYDPSNENINNGRVSGESLMSTNNNGYTNNEGLSGESLMSNNNNGEKYQGHAATYNTERQGMSDTRFMENGKYYYNPSNDDNNNNNGYTNTNNEGLSGERLMSNNNNGERYQGHSATYNTERQGMSDTRFMENGKYYYDPSNDNNNNGYTNTNNYNTNQEGVTGESLMSTNTNNNGYTNTNNYNTNKEGESFMSTNPNNNGYTNTYNNNNNNNNNNNRNGYANMERQGMSDTRFMENGKYYYDPSKSNDKTNDEGPSARPVQKAIRKTFKGTAHLAKLLPTGSVLTLQLLSPVFTHQGQCHTIVSKFMTASLLVFCGLSCFLLCFTDSFRDGRGKVRYGVATPRGMRVIDGSVTLPPQEAERFRLRAIDFVHAFMSILVFVAVVLLNDNVVSCLYPDPSEEAKEVLVMLPIGIGAVCSLLFLVFPTKRHGIGFPLSRD